MRRLILVVIVLLATLSACASSLCGSERVTPTPIPAPYIEGTVRARVEATLIALDLPISPPTVRPTPIARPTRSTPTPTPVPYLRPRGEWTVEEPATFEELEAEIEKYRGSSFVFTSWGGRYQAAQRQAYLEPFKEKFGIEIVENFSVDSKTIQAQVETGNVTLDVVDVLVGSGNQLGSKGYLEELDAAIHGKYWAGYPTVARIPWGGGGGVRWSTGLAYRLDKINGQWNGKQPSSWVDFWDTEGFPGIRRMNEKVNENIYFAQFALNPEVLESQEGRDSIARLTDGQIDLSFDKLEEIRPDIDVWLRSGNDCPLALINDEADMCTAFNVRIRNVQTEEGGDNIHYCFECGHVLQADVFSIPKGAPNKEVAELFIAWTGQPEINLEISHYLPYDPLNSQALPLLYESIDATRMDILATSPRALENAVNIDDVWLEMNLERLTKRFKEFLRSN